MRYYRFWRVRRRIEPAALALGMSAVGKQHETVVQRRLVRVSVGVKMHTKGLQRCLGVIGLVVWWGLFAAAVPASDFQDETRGLDFGTPRAAVADLVPHSTTTGSEIFWRRSDSLGLFYRGLAVREILYEFRGGRLEAVEQWAASLSCKDDSLLRALESKFGKPKLSLGGDSNRPEAPEAQCRLLGPVGSCDAFEFEGFPKDANAKGIVAWYTRYGSIPGKPDQCLQRVRFTRSSRTSAERDQTKKNVEDAFKDWLSPGKAGKQ